MIQKEYRQSVDLPDNEQEIYSVFRRFLKKNGMAKFLGYIHFCQHNPPPLTTMTHARFIEIMELAMDDYWNILFVKL